MSTSVTIKKSNQKNGKRDQVIHQEAINSIFCPIKVLIHGIKHIKSHTNDISTVIITFFTTTHNGIIPPTYVFNTTVKNTVTELHLSILLNWASVSENTQ